MVTRVVTIVGRTYGKMGVSLGTKERVKTPFFQQETERRAWRLMSVSRTIHNRTRTARRRVRV